MGTIANIHHTKTKTHLCLTASTSSRLNLSCRPSAAHPQAAMYVQYIPNSPGPGSGTIPLGSHHQDHWQGSVCLSCTGAPWEHASGPERARDPQLFVGPRPGLPAPDTAKETRGGSRRLRETLSAPMFMPATQPTALSHPLVVVPASPSCTCMIAIRGASSMRRNHGLFSYYLYTAI